MKPNHRTTIGCLLAFFLIIATIPAMAAETSKPAADTSWHFHDIVTVDFVKQHVTIPRSPDVMLIDARPKRPKYEKGHIPGAVSIPHRKFDDMVNLLPEDKTKLLIYYCGGLKCKLSHKSAKKAEALGYTNVKVFAKGFPEWMAQPGHYASVSETWLNGQLSKKADLTLFDSRPERPKYVKGHIPSAISLPHSQFEKKKGLLPEDKAALLVFYCGGYKCKLSHKSAAKTIALGYTNVKVFSAGFPAWKKAGYAVSTAQTTSSTVAGAEATGIKAGKEEGTIDAKAFAEIIAKRPDSILLIDVRDADEYEKGSMKHAVHMTVDELEKKINTLPVDKPIVFVCGTGARSGESYYMVKDLRPEIKEVYYLEGEITFKEDGTYELSESTG